MTRTWLLLTLILLSPFPIEANQHASEVRTLVLLNWSEYLDPELVAEFETHYAVKVREVYFESDDARDSLLYESDGRGYDLLMVNGVQLNAYRRRGWLAPVTEAQVPNLRHVDPRWLQTFDAAGWAAPYAWGTLGIAYRADRTPEPITHWMQFFRPSEALRERIIANRQVRDLVGMALKALGYSANSDNPRELVEAEQLLLAQKPYVKAYAYPVLGPESGLVSGRIAAAMMYSCDALILREHEPNIIFVLPSEGGNVWVDYLALSAHAANPDLALAFINFLNTPENAARLAQYVQCPSPNRAAEALLSAAYRADPLIYPSATALEHSEYYRDLDPRTLRRFNASFNRVVH